MVLRSAEELAAPWTATADWCGGLPEPSHVTLLRRIGVQRDRHVVGDAVQVPEGAGIVLSLPSAVQIGHEEPASPVVRTREPKKYLAVNSGLVMASQICSGVALMNTR